MTISEAQKIVVAMEKRIRRKEKMPLSEWRKFWTACAALVGTRVPGLKELT